MCLSPIRYYKRDKVTGQYREITFPCGRCLECIKAKQNDYVQVYYLAAKKYPHLNFATLTYNNESVPLMLSPVIESEFITRLNSDEPEFDLVEHKKRFTTQEEDEYFRSRFIEDYSTNDPMYIQRYNKYLVTASLCRQDVKDWIKRCRIRYQRQIGELPKFKYSCVGEYGTKTHRPHYHILFFGLTTEQVEFFLRDWRENFGFALNKEVIQKKTTGDSTEAVSKYLAKYQNKGCFECDIVSEGYVERPRIMISQDMFNLPQEQIEYYRGADFLGLKCLNKREYTDDDLQRINDRLFINIGSNRYRLGKHVKNKVFKNNRKKVCLNGEVKTQMRSSALQKALSEFVQRSIDEDRVREFEQLPVDYRPENYFQFEVDKEMDEQESRKNNQALLYSKAKQFYARSRF